MAKARLKALGFGWIDLPTGVRDILHPDEADLSEGDRAQVTVNRYERDPKGRAACIAHYAVGGRIQCQACELALSDRYGALGEGFIHIHHIVPLARRGRAYTLDPIRDLVPLCPNCHAMIHRLPEGQDNVAHLQAVIAAAGE